LQFDSVPLCYISTQSTTFYETRVPLYNAHFASTECTNYDYVNMHTKASTPGLIQRLSWDYATPYNKNLYV